MKKGIPSQWKKSSETFSVVKVIFSRTSKKDINKLDAVVKKRIGKKIQAYSQNPMQYARKIAFPSIGNYRWRMGNYRVTFDIKGDEIRILKVRHRKEVYK